MYIYTHIHRKRREVSKELCPFPPKTKKRKGKLNPKKVKKLRAEINDVKKRKIEVNKIKRKFFEINKINKPLDTLMRKKER